MRRYVVVEVGCLECGIPSLLLGVTGDREEAGRLADGAHPGAHYDPFNVDETAYWGGQGRIAVFEYEED